MKKIICQLCGKEKSLYCKGMCQRCYNKKYGKQYLLNNKEKIDSYRKQYQKINKEKLNHYQNDRNHKLNKHQSLSKNRKCSSYLGVHIAEQVLSKIFKNVEIMPYGNSGYDFICNNGFKIDVKSACRTKRNNNWYFNINKNKIADYFLLLSFDNREDLNPLYIWLIPNNIINNKISKSISESTMNKWDEYKLNINKVVKCCNKLRGDLK